jgi:hypothetical protein
MASEERSEREVMTRPRTFTVTYPFRSMYDVRQANDRAGYHWFSEDTLRWFRGRVSESLYGGRYFVSSEQNSGMGRSYPRLYTVREAVPDGGIETVGEFQGFSTSAKAHRAAAAYAKRQGSEYLRATIRDDWRPDTVPNPMPGTVDLIFAWFVDYTGGHAFNRDDMLTALKQLVDDGALRSYVSGKRLAEGDPIGAEVYERIAATAEVVK